jgi:hypothetical protein
MASFPWDKESSLVYEVSGRVSEVLSQVRRMPGGSHLAETMKRWLLTT